MVRAGKDQTMLFASRKSFIYTLFSDAGVLAFQFLRRAAARARPRNQPQDAPVIVGTRCNRRYTVWIVAVNTYRGSDHSLSHHYCLWQRLSTFLVVVRLSMIFEVCTPCHVFNSISVSTINTKTCIIWCERCCWISSATREKLSWNLVLSAPRR